MRHTVLAAALVATALTLGGCGGSTAVRCTTLEAVDAAGNCQKACTTDSQCDDLDVCNGREVCQAGICHPGTALFTAECRPCTPGGCDDGDLCTDDACEGRYCAHVFNSAPCDDGVACTAGDTCRDGICEAGTPDDEACSDGVGCTTDRCDVLLGCQSVAADVACADSFACTEDRCHPIADCQHTPVDARCQDGVVCTADTCDLALGCVHTPEHGACDDGVPCTANRCNPGVGCTFPADDSACEDGVGCTRDLCDPRTGCVSVPDDSLCPAALCELGTCDPVADCDLAPRPDLALCGVDALCLSGECAGSTSAVALRTDPPPCAPTTWTVKDLVHSDAERAFLALVDFTAGQWSGSACSAPTARTGLFRFAAGSLAAYGTDLGGVGHAIVDPFVLVESGATHVVGVLNTGSDSIDWLSSNWMESELDTVSGVGALTGAAIFVTGPVFNLSRTNHALFVGRSSTTPSSGITVHCTWTSGGICLPGPCVPNPTCALTTTAPSAALVDVGAWTVVSGNIRSYAGSLAAANQAAGGRGILSDHTDLNWILSTNERSDATGVWAGVVRTGIAGEHLIYGNGAVICRDILMNGNLSCAEVLGPAADRYYFDAAPLPGGGVALLARSLCAGCTTISYTLVTLPGGFSFNEDLWEEHHLSTRVIGSPAVIPQRLAAGGGTLLILGVDLTGAGAYYWQFAP